MYEVYLEKVENGWKASFRPPQALDFDGAKATFSDLTYFEETFSSEEDAKKSVTKHLVAGGVSLENINYHEIG